MSDPIRARLLHQSPYVDLVGGDQTVRWLRISLVPLTGGPCLEVALATSYNQARPILRWVYPRDVQTHAHALQMSVHELAKAIKEGGG